MTCIKGFKPMAQTNANLGKLSVRFKHGEREMAFLSWIFVFVSFDFFLNNTNVIKKKKKKRVL